MSFTKTCRKLCCFIAFVLAFCFLVGCTTINPTPSERETNKKAAEEAVSEISKGLLWDPSSMNAITSSSLTLTTKTKYDNVVISWESSEEDVIATDGSVTRLMYDDPRAVLVDGSEVIPVTLTATITGTYSYKSGEETITNEVKTTKEFNFTVKCLKPDTVGTVAECKAAAWSYIYETKGVQKALISDSNTTYNVRFTAIVTAKLLNGGKGLMVHDGTEGIYVYTDNANFEIGDTVDVVGNIYTYYGSLQVGSEITIKKVDAVEGMKTGEYREVTVQEWEDENKNVEEAVGYFGGKLLKVYAKLEKSSNGTTSDVYKLVDPYTGEVAWVYYKSYESGNTDLDAWDGKYVYIYGASYDRDSRLNKNHLLWNGKIEEAPVPELTEAEKVDQVKAVLNGLAGDHVSGTKLTLPTSNEEYGATISWKLSDETLLTNGVFAIVEADTKLTATATITVGETTVEYDVEMTVLKLTTYTIAAASKLEAGTVVKLVGTVEVVYSKYNNFYLKDATGNLLVYKSLPEGIKLGDKIELVGAMGYYNGTPQIASIISATLVSAAEWEMSAPKEMSIAEIVAFDEKTALYGQYIYAKGLLVKSGNYYYLADATDPSVRISLYNSTVAAEELVAVADTDTQVTLFFYFYGNSKGNWAEGEKRVIFVQREGEYFIGDEEVVLPETRTYQTLAEAKAMVGQEATVRGVVTAVSPYAEQYGNFGVLIEDATDGLYLYRVTGTEAYAQFVIGQEIEVTGTMDQYNGLYEMKNVQMDTFKVINEKATIPGPTPMSNELQDQGKVVELKEAVWNGSAFEKDGSTYAYFYSSSWLAEQPELVKGATYTVIGWLNWYNNPQISPLQAPELVAEAPEDPEQPEDPEYITIAEAKATAGTVTVRGVVTAKTSYSTNYGNFGALIEDATGGLYLYRVKGEDAYAKVVVGQEIEVTGAISTYKGLVELTNVTVDTITVVNENATLPTPGAMSNDESAQSKVVVLENAKWNGSAFEKDGTTYAYFYSADWLATAPSFEEGATYTVKGWVNWYNNAQITPIEAPTLVEAAPEQPEEPEDPEQPEDPASTMPEELSFSGAANKADGDAYFKSNYPNWTATGKLGQTYGGYLGFGRSGDKVSSITSNAFATTTEFTVTAVIKGNGSSGVCTSTLTFELLDKDGNVIATGYANGSATAAIAPVDAKDTTYTIEFTFVEGKTIADATNLKISFAKTTGNIGLKSVTYTAK